MLGYKGVVFIFSFHSENIVLPYRRDVGGWGGSPSGQSRERSGEGKVGTTVSKSRKKNRHSKRHAERDKHPERTSEEKRRNRKPEEWKSRQKYPVASPAGNEVNSLREMRMGKAAVGLQSSAPPVWRPLGANSTNTTRLMSKTRQTTL